MLYFKQNTNKEKFNLLHNKSFNYSGRIYMKHLTRIEDISQICLKKSQTLRMIINK